MGNKMSADIYISEYIIIWHKTFYTQNWTYNLICMPLLNKTLNQKVF